MKKVLIVDDTSFMRKLLRSIVTKHEYQVVAEAVNGEEAVYQYELYKPDLVIMDITMPVMDGLEATEAILANNPGAKIIVCSAIGQRNMIMRMIEAGARDFIVKPFLEDRIVMALEKQFQSI
ncbi:response regulator [Paenibacillus montaniterrae]|uniref:response regulator n=1 Tax=Paenibacillus montaniterrae TaxID=429341 RepID=UPI001BD06368|nr:response regulator [Paenibacillus montaniterrae]